GPAVTNAAGELVVGGSAAPRAGDGQAGDRQPTGDLVRRSPQGAPTVIGRVDGGWVRSRRSVSPAAVEAVMRTLPGVEAAAVVSTGGDMEIVAFCAPRAAEAEEILEIGRASCRERGEMWVV